MRRPLVGTSYIFLIWVQVWMSFVSIVCITITGSAGASPVGGLIAQSKEFASFSMMAKGRI